MEELIRLLVEDVLTFAYCDEDQMSEDFSVAQLERIAQGLLSAGSESIDLFVKIVHQMALEARENSLEERASKLDSMPLHLGLE